MEEPPKHPAVAALFAELLTATKLNAAGLAKKLGITPQAISNYIVGRNEPGRKMMAAIIKAFPAINAVWLATGEGQPFPNGVHGEKRPAPASAAPPAPSVETEPDTTPASMVPVIEAIPAKKLNPVAGHLFISHSLEKMLAGMTPEQQAAFWRGMFEDEVQRNKAAETDLLDRLTRKTTASSGAAAPQPFIETVVDAPTPRLIGPRFDEPVVLDFYTGQRKAA